MFDPFKDFATAGYLRNTLGEKDPQSIKTLEHLAFDQNLAEALEYLATRKVIGYDNFLMVHKILFSEFYPWAGQDRTVTAPNISVSKGDVLFCHPADARRALTEGLRLAQSKGKMVESPGLIMGFFAYGHPFLDGNGRTMLLTHMELAHRAGFSIAWASTKKDAYLAALSSEIEAPGKGILDAYLKPFVGPKLERNTWSKSVLSVKGLGGFRDEYQVGGELTDALVMEKYRLFEQKRDYAYMAHGIAETGDTMPAQAWLAQWATTTGKTAGVVGKEDGNVPYSVVHLASDGVVLDRGMRCTVNSGHLRFKQPARFS